MDLALNSSGDNRTPPTYASAHTALLPAAVLQAAEWRYLVRMLYADAGSPPVPNYPRPLVQEVLWGHAHAGAGFFEALHAALAKPAASSRSAAQRVLRRAAPDTLAHHTRAEPAPAPFEFDYGQTTARAAVVVSDDGTLRVRTGSAEDQMRPSYQLMPGARMALPAESRPKDGFSPPSPHGINTIPEFIEALRLLQRWSGLNLRELEEQSKKKTFNEPTGRVVWLARSTVSDMLRRNNKLPKPETLRAYTAACGVTSAEQERWLNARDRLARGAEHRRKRRSGADPDGQDCIIL